MRAIANLAQIAEDIEPTANPETLDNLKLLRSGYGSKKAS